MLRFLTKTAVYGAWPEAFARIRSARAQRGHISAEMAAPGFRESGDLAAREYGSYDGYLAHQAEKYRRMLEKSGGLGRRALVAYRVKFFRRFRALASALPRDASIVCAGARDGTEVEVWRDLGFSNAVGFDLNPGPDNPYVKPGDFNHLPVPDHSAHLYYSNAVDHAFDLDTMFKEARRVLRDDGVALFDIGTGSAREYEAVNWRRPEIPLVKLLDHFGRLEAVERSKAWLFVTVRP